ncbi:MAG: type II secretion system F family protein [Streptosporangiaceae bacterium]
MMTTALLGGAAFGFGLYLLYRALFPSRPGLATSLATLDVARGSGRRAPRPSTGQREQLGPVRRWLGERLVAFCAEHGWQFRSTRSDLALLGRSFEGFLATKCLLAAGALITIPFLAAWLSFVGLSINLGVPLWAGLIFAAVFFFLPDLQVKQDAFQRRRDFRHVVGSFLDLVAMNLAGGRGVPEALLSASSVGEGWAMRRIRDALQNARITGTTPWEALGDLGEEVGVDELCDLSAALTLVADDGAKVRSSLTARAATMRRKQMADLEGKAGERSQSMLVAQLLLCAGFLLFLIFPAVMRVMNA